MKLWTENHLVICVRLYYYFDLEVFCININNVLGKYSSSKLLYRAMLIFLQHPITYHSWFMMSRFFFFQKTFMIFSFTTYVINSEADLYTYYVFIYFIYFYVTYTLGWYGWYDMMIDRCKTCMKRWQVVQFYYLWKHNRKHKIVKIFTHNPIMSTCYMYSYEMWVTKLFNFKVCTLWHPTIVINFHKYFIYPLACLIIRSDKTHSVAKLN